MVKNEKSREFLNSQIQTNPLDSKVAVKDNRAEKIVFDNEHKWASKQMGLGWSENR